MWSLDDFETIRELGAGCSSVVYLMRHTREDTLVAAKRIQLEYDENNENSLAGEVQAAKREVIAFSLASSPTGSNPTDAHSPQHCLILRFILRPAVFLLPTS